MASTWCTLNCRVTATSRHKPRPRVSARKTPINVSGGSFERRFAYTIASADSRQKPNMPPYGAFSGSPMRRPTHTPVMAACPSAALKNAIRRATTRWLSPPSNGASNITETNPRTRNGYSKRSRIVCRVRRVRGVRRVRRVREVRDAIGDAPYLLGIVRYHQRRHLALEGLQRRVEPASRGFIQTACRLVQNQELRQRIQS